MTKKQDWDVMICGDWDDSDESEFMPRKEFHKFVVERVASLTGSEVSSAGEVMNQVIIPTPTWRKIGEVESEASSASTLLLMVRWADPGLFQGCNGVNVPWEPLVRT